MKKDIKSLNLEQLTEELLAIGEKNKYTIKFVNEDGTILETKTVEYGVVPTYTGKTPEKAADEKYTYTFAGWTPSVTEVKGNTIYTATYKRTINSYEVIFIDEDGTTLAETQKIEYGNKATRPTEPEKEGYNKLDEIMVETRDLNSERSK